MARGFLSGAIAGVVVAGLGAGTVSVLTGPVFAPQPGTQGQAPSQAAPQAPAVDAPPATTPTAPGDQGAQTSPGVPDAPADVAAPSVETEPAPVPETNSVETQPDAPDVADSTAPEVAADAPVTIQTDAAQPDAPEAEDLSISTSPAQPPAPAEVAEEILEEAAPLEGDAEVAEADSAPEEAGEVDDGDIVATDAGDAVTQEETIEEAEPELTDASPSAEEGADVPDVEVATAPQQPRLPSIGDEDAAVVAEEEVALADTQAAPAPSLGNGASDFSKLDTGVTTGRLPSAGGNTTSQDADAPAAGTAASGPLVAFAQPPAVAPDKAMMSIILVDDGSTPLGLEALEAFPYPLTFAVDTEWDGATGAMEKYRAAGFEVMALANMPVGAQPSDVKISMEAALASVPEAVAVLEGAGGGLQGNRDVSDQVTSILAETGHGLVMYPKGLNTAVSLAQREGVAAQSLFRDFDGQGQNATVIRRFLDQAAFKAGQQGAVIMLGRLRADTISALLIWGLQDRASRVSLVPVSSVLTNEGLQ